MRLPLSVYMDLNNIERGTHVARDLSFSEPITCREVKRVMKDVNTGERLYYTVHECADRTGEVLTADELKQHFAVVEDEATREG